MTLAALEWKISSEPVPYEEAVNFMEKRVEAIINEGAPELVWLLEHPSIYTAGTSANKDDIKDPERFPVYHTGRGGQYTYHGPGIQIAYVMLNLKKRNMQDVKQYVYNLEEWIIQTLNHYHIASTRREGRVGIWVPRTDSIDDKIAAIGIRIRRWVTFHGIAINRAPDLSHFDGIIPCGISEHGITSLEKLGQNTDGSILHKQMKEAFLSIF